MAKMRMRVQDRPKVKVECLRLLASLKLDPAKATLIGGFIDSYLRLSAQELKQYERELAALPPSERQKTMEIVTSWHQEGITQGMAQGITQGMAQGIMQGKETLVLRQLRRRLGEVSANAATRLDRLSPEQLDDLGEALLDFGTEADLEQWLARH